MALWDLKAGLLDLPLQHLLGATRKHVPVYGSGGFTTYDEGQLRHQLGHWALEQRIPNLRHLQWFHDHGRIESMLFDGTLDPIGGTITPDSQAPGNGLTFKTVDAEPHLVR